MSPRIRFVSYLLVCLALVVFLGCSSKDSIPSKESKKKEQVTSKLESHSTAGSANFDLCDLLTDSDIHEFFPGASIKITKKGDKAFEVLGTRKCFYELSEGDMVFIQTELMRTQDMSPSLQKQGRTAEGNYLANKKYVENLVPVEGLGKDAYYGGSGLKMGAGLNILLDRDTVLNVMVGLGRGNDDDQAHLKIEKALAEKIISRL